MSTLTTSTLSSFGIRFSGSLNPLDCTTRLATSTSTELVTPPSIAQRPKKPPRPTLHTAVILDRSPILTRTPTPFDAPTMPTKLPGSLLESKFNLEERRRDRKAFGPGFGADHPLAPGAGVTAQDLKKFGRDEDETPASRVHASDINNDVKSLDRKGQRNLYLLIQQKGAVWKFPETKVADNELLHESAARDLKELCGEAMDTWIVSRNPIGLYEIQPPTPPTDPALPPKTCVFFFKAHIMAGQVKPGKTVTDFAWLTKREIAKRVDQQYWDGIKDMLSDF
ncbi:50S ribosomal subunit L30 [Multifurca ochricompacta]|uniref:50S ribosomal subunit L30 n=1 Tax=Multifurca ochricompacta TaxID=376703 RepID=A0AAD4QSC2_9AGAM|nr:50S ribosomal subunit L30 [Multifurca ochricompacta]